MVIVFAGGRGKEGPKKRVRGKRKGKKKGYQGRKNGFLGEKTSYHESRRSDGSGGKKTVTRKRREMQGGESDLVGVAFKGCGFFP